MVKLVQRHAAVLMLIFFLSLQVSGQQGYSPERMERLMELSRRLHEEAQAAKEEALQWAIANRQPWRTTTDDGRIIELMAIVDGMPFYNITTNAEGAAVINSDKLYPGGSAGLTLNGAGQLLGIWDSGKVRNTHAELTGRVTQKDGATSLTNHATHVAGTMMAAGVEPEARGMSYGADLHAYDWNSDAAEMAEAAATDGLQLSQHSYVYITGWFKSDGEWYWYGNVNISEEEDYRFGFYSSQTQLWDNIAHDAPNYLIVKSAGNSRNNGPQPGTFHYYYDFIAEEWTSSTQERQLDGGDDGYDCIPVRGNAKNILTVGAVTKEGEMASFSSWGPTDDGRIKPDIVAKGVSVYSTGASNNNDYYTANGTSMSGPMVSGSAGLLLEHQQNLHPDTLLTAASLKALILHSADDMVSGAAGPDYRFGWGMMDTEAAAAIMTENAASRLHIHELSLNDGEEIRFRVKATGNEALRATIVWTDVPGTPPPASLNPTDLMLVNDLDMRLTGLSSNTTYYPYILDPEDPATAATTGDNFRDNVEMIHIAEPGQYESFELSISHKGTLTDGSQDFSLIISGNIEATTRWTGTVSQSWDDPDNWSAGTPVSGETVVIAAAANNPILAADKSLGALSVESNAELLVAGNVHLTAESLHIAEDATLTLAPGAWLTADDSLANDGLLWLQSNAAYTASLLHNDEGVNARIGRHFAGAKKWRLVSSPVENQAIENDWTPAGTYPDGSGYDFYSYDESAATWRNQKVPGNHITHFIPGRGYLVSYQSADQNKIFEEPVNTGSVSVSISHTEGVPYAGANLIGNPYATGIDWHLADHTPFADDYAYVYDPFLYEGSGGYVHVNGTEEGAFIAPHQGFFVIKEDPGTVNFTFQPAMRDHGGTFVKKMTPAKTEQPRTAATHTESIGSFNDTGEEEEELVLQLTGLHFYGRTVFQLRKEASFGRDRGDALKFFSFNRDAPQLYSLSDDGRQLAVSSIPYLPAGKAIALGVYLPVPGNYTLSVHAASSAFTEAGLYLRDTQLGRLHKLTADTPYRFIGNPADPSGRFLLFFGDVSVGLDDEPAPPPEVSIRVHNNTLFIAHAEENALVSIYDTRGRLLLQFRTATGEQGMPLSLPPGAYIVSVTEKKTTTSTKILLQ